MASRLIRLSMVLAALLVPWIAAAATAPVARTGQTQVYAAGDNGTWQAGVAAPDPRFVVNMQADGVTPDGTISDRLTGLVWLQNGHCTEAAGGVTQSSGTLVWADALTWSNTLASGTCGLKDGSSAGQWRLPNRRELGSLIHFGVPDSAAWLNTQGFSNVLAASYWSSSTSTSSTGAAWTVLFLDGVMSPAGKGSFGNVWPVRSGTAGALTLSAASWNYGSVAVNTTSTSQTFTLTNNGAGYLAIIGFSKTGNSGDFNIDPGDGSNGSCGTARTLAPGSSCSLSATFAPVSSGAKTITLRIASNDPVTANMDLALSGTGVLPTYNVDTVVAGGNGTVVCASPVNQGSDSACTIIPGEGYYLAAFSDNGVDKLTSAVAGSYGIKNITAPHAISATFAINTYTVTPAAGSGSSITPAVEQIVNSGAITSFTVEPLAGYGILLVSGCNGALSGTSYTTGAITDNCTITVNAVKRNASTDASSNSPSIGDAMKALQAYHGSINLTATEKIAYDVAPLTTGGVPKGNGVVDLADVIIVLRRVVGIGNW